MTSRCTLRRATAWCALAVLGLVSRSATANAQSAEQLWGTGTVTWLASDRLQVRVQVQPEAQADRPARSADFFQRRHDAARVVHRRAVDRRPGRDRLWDQEPEQRGQHHVGDAEGWRAASHPLEDSRWRRGRAVGSLSRGSVWISGRFCDSKTTRQKSSTDSSFSSSWTFRDRFHVAYPLNRPKVTSSGAVYLAADTEAFVPLDEGFINELRVRSGVGYRRSFPWRFEALYVWTGERSHPSEPLAVKNQALDLRVFFQF